MIKLKIPEGCSVIGIVHLRCTSNSTECDRIYIVDSEGAVRFTEVEQDGRVTLRHGAWCEVEVEAG